MIFLDLEGLTNSYNPAAYAELLGLEYDEVVTDRLHLLKQLREGIGITVLTGPLGATWWGLTSREVNVRIVPDGTDYTERFGERVWSWLAAGCTRAEASELGRRGKGPTPKHRLYHKWNKALELRAKIRSGTVTGLVSVGLAVDILEPPEGCALLDKLDEFVSLDWEWVPKTGEPLGLVVSNADHNWYIPLWAQDVHWRHFGGTLTEAFTRTVKRVPSVFHNGRSDLGRFVVGDPLDLAGGVRIDDTLLMAYVLDPNADDLGLKTLVRQRLDRDPQDYPGDLENRPVAAVARYAGADTRNTYDLYIKLLGELVATDQYRIYDEYERPLVPIVASMEKYGSPVDIAEVARLWQEFSRMEVAMRGYVWQRFRRDLVSDNDTRALIADLAGYDPGTLDQRYISKYQERWMDVVLGFRKCRTLRRNYLEKYVEKWWAQGCPSDFRLYPQFNQAGRQTDDSGLSFKPAPRSGRFSSSGDVNLQQQGQHIRTIFCAPPGKKFWSLDYSGLELHIAASISQDPVMLGALQRGEKLHRIFQTSIEEITGTEVEYVVAKAGNFEQLYEGSAATLQQILAKDRNFIDNATADAIVRAHATQFSVYHADARQAVVTAREKGYAETIAGRRRVLDDLYTMDPGARSHAERGANNHRIQGTAADILKRVMDLVVPVLKEFGAHMSLQNHDELAGWVDPEPADEFLRGMITVMESIELPGLKLTVEGGIGNTWADAH